MFLIYTNPNNTAIHGHITTQRISPASAGGGFYLSAQSEYNLRLFGQRFYESPLLVKSRALKIHLKRGAFPKLINEIRKKHVLQWHICHKCNLRCSHCYQDDYKAELSFEELKKIFLQYKDFCRKYNYRGHINFTGGEPFLSENFFPLLDLCEEHKNTFGILTNGTFLDEAMVSRLKQYTKLSFVQISLDGWKRS